MLMDLSLFAVGFFTGTLGALLGIGGGVVVVPFLVLFVKVPIRMAIGTSFIAVLSTSLAASISYLKTGLCDIDTGISLEGATVTGAAAGAYLAGIVDQKFLHSAFSVILLYVSIAMFRKKREDAPGEIPAEKTTSGGSGAAHVASFFAGIISGSLGVGGGIVKVPVLHRLLRFPMAHAVGTSSFMIGITVATSTLVFTVRGDVDPYIAVPLVAGIILGAQQGAKLMPRVPEKALKVVFSLLLIYFAVKFISMGVM